jgi:signal transduction histidine kinase
MRRRLILGVLISVLLTGVLIGVPLVVASDIGLRRTAQESATYGAERTAAVLELRIADGEPNDREALSPYFIAPRLVTITFLDTGTTDVYGVEPEGRTVTGVARTDNVEVTVVESIASIGSQEVVAVRIAATTALAMLIAFLVSRRRARKIADELEALAVEAERIGSGDTRPATTYPWPEFDKIARSLDASSRRVQELVRRERAVVADITHQLRTPLTAISLRLDEIADADDLAVAREEALIAQEQVLRLSGVIDDLLNAAREREAPRGPMDLDDVLRQQALEWAPVFAAAGRTLSVSDNTGVRVVAAPGALGQVLAILLENASVHGAGAVSVSVRDSARGVVVEVADEGPGIPPDLGSTVFERRVSGGSGSGGSGSGLGLSLARALAEHMGARLELVSASPAVFGLFLEPEDTDLDEFSVGESVSGERGAAVPEALDQAVESGEPAEATSGSSALSGNTQRR